MFFDHLAFTLLSNKSCTNFELHKFFLSPKNLHLKAIMDLKRSLLYEKSVFYQIYVNNQTGWWALIQILKSLINEYLPGNLVFLQMSKRQVDRVGQGEVKGGTFGGQRRVRLICKTGTALQQRQSLQLTQWSQIDYEFGFKIFLQLQIDEIHCTDVI